MAHSKSNHLRLERCCASRLTLSQKKGAQAQKHIAQIKQAAAQAKTPEQKKKDAEKAEREKEKEAAEKAKRETAELFKPVQVQKVPFGVDPKTVVCQFWKKGNCEKGKKCKFAHDLAVERKAEKRDLYSDSRNQEDEKQKDDMADWDEGSFRTKYSGVLIAYLGNSEATRGSIEQTRKPKDDHGQGLQVFYRSSGKFKIRMVLGMSKRRGSMQIQTQLAARVCYCPSS